MSRDAQSRLKAQFIKPRHTPAERAVRLALRALTTDRKATSILRKVFSMTSNSAPINDDVMESALRERFPAPAYAKNVLTDVYEDAKRLFLDFLIEVDYVR